MVQKFDNTMTTDSTKLMRFFKRQCQLFSLLFLHYSRHAAAAFDPRFLQHWDSLHPVFQLSISWAVVFKRSGMGAGPGREGAKWHASESVTAGRQDAPDQKLQHRCRHKLPVNPRRICPCCAHTGTKSQGSEINMTSPVSPHTIWTMPLSIKMF